ncbi:MAG: hypothetical protein JST80_12780 [Bdellovibrionales bacterium]|nr:hypothetical protein [Bdellovibrionales bacterium]
MLSIESFPASGILRRVTTNTSTSKQSVSTDDNRMSIGEIDSSLTAVGAAVKYLVPGLNLSLNSGAPTAPYINVGMFF